MKSDNYNLKKYKKYDEDKQKLKAINLSETLDKLEELLKNNPYQTPPEYKNLKGHLSGLTSRRLNLKHRLIYKIDEEEKTIYILSIWGHFT